MNRANTVNAYFANKCFLGGMSEVGQFSNVQILLPLRQPLCFSVFE